MHICMMHWLQSFPALQIGVTDKAIHGVLPIFMIFACSLPKQ